MSMTREQFLALPADTRIAIMRQWTAQHPEVAATMASQATTTATPSSMPTISTNSAFDVNDAKNFTDQQKCDFAMARTSKFESAGRIFAWNPSDETRGPSFGLVQFNFSSSLSKVIDRFIALGGTTVSSETASGVRSQSSSYKNQGSAGYNKMYAELMAASSLPTQKALMQRAQLDVAKTEYFQSALDAATNLGMQNHAWTFCFLFDCKINGGMSGTNSVLERANNKGDISNVGALQFCRNLITARIERTNGLHISSGGKNSILDRTHTFAGWLEDKASFAAVTTTFSDSVSAMVSTYASSSGGFGDLSDMSAAATQYASYDSGTVPDTERLTIADTEFGYYDAAKTEVMFEQYGNLQMPMAPVLEMQYLSDISESNDPVWSNINVYPYNHVRDFNLVCNGVYNADIKLMDIEYQNLEDYIIKALFLVNMKKLAEEQKIIDSATTSGSIQTSFVPASLANIRYRFGWTPTVGGVSYTTSDEFQNRDEAGIVRMSPWIEGMIFSADYQDGQDGLTISMKVSGTIQSVLDNCKIINNGAKFEQSDIKGLLTQFLSPFTPGGGLTIPALTFEFHDNPDATIIQLDVPDRIQPSEDEQYPNNWATLRSYLDTICGKVPVHIYDRYGNQKDLGWSEWGGHTPSKTLKYKYKIGWDTSGNRCIPKIVFGYFAEDLDQKSLRVYKHRYTSTNNVISCDLKLTSLTAAVSSVSVVQGSGSGSGYTVRLAGYTPTPDRNNNVITCTNIHDLSSMLRQDGPVFVSDVSNPRIPGGGTIKGAISHELNKQLCNGELQILGDPFFLHDLKISPFMYKIRLKQYRPDGYESFTSGDYLIGEVTHNISMGNFTTSIKIQKAY